jgi:hypothetical protein
MMHGQRLNKAFPSATWLLAYLLAILQYTTSLQYFIGKKLLVKNLHTSMELQWVAEYVI